MTGLEWENFKKLNSEIWVDLVNNKESNLGEPLPKGNIRFYDEDNNGINNFNLIIDLNEFVKIVRETYPDKDIWAFTGYIYDKDLVEGGRKYCKFTDELLSMIDVLVDGPFIAEEKDITLKFRGSRNQRVLDLKETRKMGHIVLAME